MPSGFHCPRSILFLVMLALAVAPAVRAVDEDPAAIAAHGQELEKQHRYAEAIAEYDKLVNRWPRSADPYTLRGWARHLAGDDLHGLAVEDLRTRELKHIDPQYELVITVRAVKPLS